MQRPGRQLPQWPCLRDAGQQTRLLQWLLVWVVLLQGLQVVWRAVGRVLQAPELRLPSYELGLMGGCLGG